MPMAVVGALCAIPVCWTGIAFGESAAMRDEAVQKNSAFFLSTLEGTPLPSFSRDWDGRAIPVADRWVVVAPECDTCSAVAFSWDAANQVGVRDEPVIVLLPSSRKAVETRYGPNPYPRLYPFVAPGVWKHPYANVAGRVRDGRFSSPQPIAEVAKR